MPALNSRAPPAAVLAAGLVLGSVSARALGAYTAAAVPLTLLIGVGAALLLGPSTRRGLAAALLCAALVAGGLRAEAVRPAPLPSGLESGPVRLELDVTRVSAGPSEGAGASWWLEGRHAGADGTATVRVRIPAVDGRPPSVLPGDRVALALVSVATTPSATGNEQRLHARVPSASAIRRLSPARGLGGRVGALAARVRSSARSRLVGATGDRSSAALLACLLVGDREAVAPHTRAAFRRAGLAHLLAVSGLHVVLLARVLEALLQRVLTPWLSARRLQIALTAVLLPALAGYALVCGGAVPVVRAAVFLAVARLASCLDRRTTTLDHVAVAAALVVVASPEESGRPGFHLSFAAVAGMALLTRRFEEALFPGLVVLRAFPEAVSRLRLRAHEGLARAVSAALAAHVGAAPVVAAAFGDVHVIGPLVNVPAVALTAWLLPAAAVGALLGSGLPFPAGALLRFGVRALVGCADAAAAMPFATLATGAAPAWSVAGAGLLLLVGARLPHWRRRHLLLPLASLVLLCAGALAATHHPRSPELRALDVGHGQALLLRTPDAAVLVDAGGRLPRVAARRIARAFDQLGVRRLDALVLTHEDSDHCGAVGDVLATASVARAVVPNGFGGDPAAEEALALLRDAGVPILRVGRGDVLDVGGVRLTVLHPRADRPGPVGNSGSLVLHVAAGTADDRLTALLPGDLEGLALEALARDPTLPRASVLLLPHHGRGATESFRRLIHRCEATHVIASAAAPTHVALHDVLVTGRDGIVTVSRGAVSTER